MAISQMVGDFLLRLLVFEGVYRSSALSIPKGAPIEGIRIWVNVWIIMKSWTFYHMQAVTTSETFEFLPKLGKSSFR